MKNIKTMHNAVGTLMERREDTDIVNEAMYTVIDPRGNPGPIAPKVQVVRYAKKMGGAKKGYFVVPSKNIGKAQKLYGKFGADITKLQEPMADLFYESELNEGRLQDEVEEWVRELDKNGYSRFADDYKVDPNDTSEMMNFLMSLSNSQAKKILKDLDKGLYESKLTEAAPRMRKNKEVEELEKLKQQVIMAQKGGMGNRYGKEFDKAKQKAIVAIDNMISYSKIGV